MTLDISFPGKPARAAHARVILLASAKLAGPAAAIDKAGGGALGRALKAARFEGDAASLVELMAPAGLDATRLLVLGTGPAAKAAARPAPDAPLPGPSAAPRSRRPCRCSPASRRCTAAGR